ncbi:hypothetical protein LJC53_06400 [Bacteroidales bacterium OttesenSCG-928-C03]|nr:hypothetical protein [Bacteroidales bacterium OttesenSCG-928-C03]
MQKAFYDEDMLQYYRDNNEEHLYWEMFDLFDKGVVESKTHNKLIGLNHSDIKTFTVELTKKLTELFQKINLRQANNR